MYGGESAQIRLLRVSDKGYATVLQGDPFSFFAVARYRFGTFLVLNAERSQNEGGGGGFQLAVMPMKRCRSPISKGREKEFLPSFFVHAFCLGAAFGNAEDGRMPSLHRRSPDDGQEVSGSIPVLRMEPVTIRRMKHAPLRGALLGERSNLLEVDSRFLRLARRREDRPFILAENANPGGDIRRMIRAWFGRNF